MIAPALHPTEARDLPHLRFHGWEVSVADELRLRDLDLDVPEGRIVGLVGPAGSGKSTLLASVNRQLSGTPGLSVRGEVLLGGVPLWGAGVDDLGVRRRTGTVFRDPVVLPGSVFANVVFPLRLDGLRSRSRLEEAAERALRESGAWEELRDRLSEPAAGLEPGLRARVNLARALVGQPEILLLDEPCALLDSASTDRFEDAVRGLAGRCTVLVATHNLAQASRITQRLAFLLEGRLEEYGPTERVFRRPVRRTTEDYLSGRFAS